MISIDRLEAILDKFKNVRIAVLGDMMLDEYLIGKVNRISPEAPVPVVNITEEKFVLGGASNVANNLRKLDGSVLVYGVIGEDKNGKRFIEELENNGIDASGIVVDKSRPTIIKSRVLSQGQQLLRLDWEKNESISREIEDKILAKIEKNMDKIDGILLSDYNKGVLTEYVSTKIIELGKKYDKKVIVDPKPENFSNYVGATSMTPNRKEIMDFLKISKFDDEEQIREGMKRVREELSLESLVLTRSEEGFSLLDGESYAKVPTVAREVFDVTGAGDTFISTLIMAISAGATLYEAGIVANMAAGVVVAKVGTATVTKEEIIEFFHNKMEK